MILQQQTISDNEQIAKMIDANIRSTIKIAHSQCVSIIQLQMDFKQFVRKQIDYYVLHLKKKRVLLELNSEPKHQINLSFSHLSDLYLAYLEQHPQQQTNQSGFNVGFSLQLKVGDQDLAELWEHIDNSYEVGLNLENQDVGDETLLRLSELYNSGRCALRKLRFSGNQRITGVGLRKLGQSLQTAPHISEIYLHGLQIDDAGINRIIQLLSITPLTTLDLGKITDSSLKYLAQVLENHNYLQWLSFGQSGSEEWSTEGKSQFCRCVRRSPTCKQILAVNLYPDNLAKHTEMVSELNIICRKNRNLKIEDRENQFKAASLNPNHPKYYEPDNHSLNAYKFSVKSYLNNVFGSLLDEALYFLEKQRRNSLREEAIFNITKEPINKIILEDICTADGSIIVLTKYLLKKIQEKESHH